MTILRLNLRCLCARERLFRSHRYEYMSVHWESAPAFQIIQGGGPFFFPHGSAGLEDHALVLVVLIIRHRVSEATFGVPWPIPFG